MSKSKNNRKNTKLPQPKGSADKNNVQSKNNPSPIYQLTPYFLVVLAVFIFLCLITGDMFGSADALGVVGRGTRNVVCGLFGVTAYVLPFALAYIGIRWNKFTLNHSLHVKGFVSVLSMIDLASVIHVFQIRSNGVPYGMKNLAVLYAEGKALNGGGMIGGFFGECSYKLFNVMGTAVIGIALLIVFLIFLAGISPVEAWNRLRVYVKYVQERARINREEAAAKAEEKEASKVEERERERVEVEQRIKQHTEKKIQKEEEKRLKESMKVDKDTKQEIIDRCEEEHLDRIFAAGQQAQVNEEKPSQKKKKLEELERISSEKMRVARLSEEQEKREVDTHEEEKQEDKKQKAGLTAFIGKAAKGEDNSILEDDEEALDKLFIDPVDSVKPSANQAEKIEVRKVALKKIESEECTADGVCLGEGDVEEETREERKERLSKLDARGNELIEYTFPPFNLLKMESESAIEEADAELRSNADTLMRTFDNFKVGIKEISYSRGPTITRYELLPDSGTRIKTIANLVDDLSLALATSGLRMEAPIPNKSLVGIEVPNRVRSNVYARQLIESDTFSKAESRLWTCLGKDVAGSPVFFDISKMPHLLIAGATGMGKSVCINTIIISLLYKARPDEVKLMLIDPKKVEFGVYNGIPHLLVPVVTDPKKSAGTLQWAVNEMERRFELIESVNMRDIKSYNAITAGDPEKEFMPHIVIIIDELADLMMTAADDVETSICRLAQKARAAGIHLIIGTQRPSVDVITGLIKSNIPSRIAFTVASQIDSRTILDTAGAEKLIGKGDMLFNPVGAMKPIRVQGAYISEDEVINITNFIKANSSAVKYDDGVISSIEEAAAMCGQKKGSSSAAAAQDAMIGDADPLFRRALEISVDNGSVATSMLQRNINVGYGRAARIIDRMEKLRFVSPPRGNKHREVLITREQFDQMVMDNDPRVDGISEK